MPERASRKPPLGGQSRPQGGEGGTIFARVGGFTPLTEKKLPYCRRSLFFKSLNFWFKKAVKNNAPKNQGEIYKYQLKRLMKVEICLILKKISTFNSKEFNNLKTGKTLNKFFCVYQQRRVRRKTFKHGRSVRFSTKLTMPNTNTINKIIYYIYFYKNNEKK